MISKLPKILFLLIFSITVNLLGKVSVTMENQTKDNLSQIREIRKSSEVMRPELPETYQTTNFILHYTLTGEDAVPSEDSNKDGINDYISTAAQAAEYSYELLIDSLDYTAPPIKNDKIHIYFYDLAYLNWGTPTLEGTVDSTERENDHYASMNIENDFDGDYGLDKYQAVKITVAHEFFHIIQLSYNYFQDGNLPGQLYGDDYFLEWSSTWFEDIAYPEVNHYDYELYDDFFNSPSSSLWSYDYRYSLASFLKYLSEKYGVGIVRQIWEEIKKGEKTFNALKNILSKKTTNTLAWHWNDFFRKAYYTGGRYEAGKAICKDAKHFAELSIDSTDYPVFSNEQPIESGTSPYATNSFSLSFDKSQYLETKNGAKNGDSLWTSYIKTADDNSDTEGEFNLIKDPFLGKVSSKEEVIIFATNKTMQTVSYDFTVSERPRPYVTSRIEKVYPNPIDPGSGKQLSVKIKTDLRNNQFNLALFNILGQKISSKNYILPPEGDHTRIYKFPLSDTRSSGIYILRFKSGRDADARKITILK